MIMFANINSLSILSTNFTDLNASDTMIALLYITGTS